MNLLAIANAGRGAAAGDRAATCFELTSLCVV